MNISLSTLRALRGVGAHNVTNRLGWNTFGVGRNAVRGRRNISLSNRQPPTHTHPGELSKPPASVPKIDALKIGSEESTQYLSMPKAPRKPFSWRTLEFKSIPRPSLLLGLAGTIPFTTGAAAIVTSVFSEDANAAVESALINYSACILSFMGAVHWGLEIAKFGGSHAWLRYGLGVAPPLVAWMSLGLPTSGALAVQISAFLIVFAGDLQSCRLGLSPNWYPALRLIITPVVIVSLGCVIVNNGYVYASKYRHELKKRREEKEGVLREEELIPLVVPDGKE